MGTIERREEDRRGKCELKRKERRVGKGRRKEGSNETKEGRQDGRGRRGKAGWRKEAIRR